MELKETKGFCFVEYANKETGARVLEQTKSQPLVMKGRTLMVEERKHPKPQPVPFDRRKESRGRDRNNARERAKPKVDGKPSYYKPDLVIKASNDDNMNGTNNAGTDSDGFHNVGKGNRKRVNQKKETASHQ